MSLGSIPWARAQAAALAGWVSKNVTMDAALQASAPVPP